MTNNKTNKTKTIGEILNGTVKERTTAKQITLYKPVGVGVQDAVAAQLDTDVARERGAGAEIAFLIMNQVSGGA